MIPELGHYALILALLVALAQTHPLLARQGAVLQFVLCALAFAALTWAYVTSDFTVLNVADNSHTLKPMIYKVAGVWGNHEGSMLLWLLMLSLFGMLVALRQDERRVLQIHGLIGAGFLAYTLLASNPFERIYPPPFDGMDLNPVLQDPALALHPPLLYMGYVGFSVAFAYAVAALWDGKADRDWASAVRPWVMLAWTALSAGIALGSWWAYYELGWGGWWFWDPVENASLMPWLVGTALLHSVIVMQTRGGLRRWTVLLAITAFSLSLLGTFLVRSGVLTSVHAFAVDPQRGVFILALLVLYTGGALLLYALRAGNLKSDAAFSPASRESLLVFNNLFLATMTATVLIGTLYPLALSALDAGQISVGPPYFHLTFVPLAVPLLILVTIGPFVPWKKGDPRGIAGKLRAAAFLTALTLLMTLFAGHSPLLPSLLGSGLAAWLIYGALTEAATRLGLFRLSGSDIMRRLAGTSPARWGMTLAHLGLGIAVLGMTGTGLWLREHTAVLQPGDKMSVAHFELTLTEVGPAFGPNYTAIRAIIDGRNTRSGRHFTLMPENRHFTIADEMTTEAAIRQSALSDIYVVLGERGDDGWVINAKTHPFVKCLWLGFFLITLGGALALWPVRRNQTEAPAA